MTLRMLMARGSVYAEAHLRMSQQDSPTTETTAQMRIQEQKLTEAANAFDKAMRAALDLFQDRLNDLVVATVHDGPADRLEAAGLAEAAGAAKQTLLDLLRYP